MHTMRKLFGGLAMGWRTVIVFALVTGAITGVVAVLPFTENTSFRDIAISYEWWVIFAFVIASNCSKNWESALKTFVFFLISQPLCYAVEVAICTLAPDLSPNPLTVDMALYYYTSIWGPMTLLTLPGGFVAFYITKPNALGAAILGLGNAIQGILGVYYLMLMVQAPPRHLLTAIVCFASIVVMTLSMQHEKKNRIIVFSVAAVATLVAIAFAFLRNGTLGA